MVRPPTFGSERDGAEDASRRRPPYSQPYSRSVRTPPPAAAPRSEPLPPVRTLIDHYGSGLVAYGTLWIADPGDREQVVAQAMILARHAHEDRYPGATHLRAWMYALVRVSCLAYPESGGFSTASFPGLAGGLAAHARGVELTRTALSILDRREREILELLYRHRLTGQEAAAVLGVPAAEAARLAAHGEDVAEAFVAAVLLAISGRSRCAEADQLATHWVDDPRREAR